MRKKILSNDGHNKHYSLNVIPDIPQEILQAAAVLFSFKQH